MNLSERKLKERKVRQELILSGALDVFKAKGIEGSTMDEIALASGFGKATLYYYFKSKEDYEKYELLELANANLRDEQSQLDKKIDTDFKLRENAFSA